jgi:hypothetical protein
MFLGSKVRLSTLPPSVSRLSRQCGILNISQAYRPPRLVTGISLLFFFYFTHANLDLRNTTLGHGFHFERRHSRTFPIKALRMIVDAPWYVPNTLIRRDLQVPTVKEEIRRYSSQYIARLSAHPNDLIVNLIELPDNRRLRRHLPNDLPTRFLV